MEVPIGKRDVAATVESYVDSQVSKPIRPANTIECAARNEVESASREVPSQLALNSEAVRGEESTTSLENGGLSTFMRVRRRLFGIACRMVRSAAEAEDIVQDVWVRWQTADRGQVRDAEAFLVITAARLAINVLQSARLRREGYVGRQLPEPVDTRPDPGLGAERSEETEMGLRLLQERLSPTERAAYILREAFDYPYRDIARVLRLEEANARQVVTRARQHVASGRRMPTISGGQRGALQTAFAAARNGDVAAVEGILCANRHVPTRHHLRIARRDRVDCSTLRQGATA
jgi:RNA polymerase sigma factor (sigma-70 family)